MIWLVGNKGMLGTAVEALLKRSGTQYLASDREVDITNAEAIEAFLAKQLKQESSERLPDRSRPDGTASTPAGQNPVGNQPAGHQPISPDETGRPGGYRKPGSIAPEETEGPGGYRDAESASDSKLDCIINCAAYTAVDRAEEDARAAGRLNSTGPKNLAYAARRHGTSLIHVSTDYVFDGTKEAGYHEDDPQGAVSVYGRTKLAGEEAIRRSGASHYIVRTAWLFGEHGPNFVATMLSRFVEGKPVRVVNDQWGSPTYAGDLAEALVRLAGVQLPDASPGADATPEAASGRVSPTEDDALPSGEAPRPPQGFYHFTNRGRINWYDFAREIFFQAREMGLCPEGSTITPVPSSEYPTKARRPVYSFLHTDRIREALGMEIRPYQEALHSYLTSIKNQRNIT